MLEQVGTTLFRKSACDKAKLYIENDMAAGDLHDFLMEVKGHVVDIMVKAHKAEQDLSEAQKKAAESPIEVLTPVCLTE